MFFAPVGLRRVWRTAFVEALSSPRIALDAARARIDIRTLARFLVWRETARCLGVASLVASDADTAILGRHLPAGPHRPLRSGASFAGLVITKNEQATLRDALQSVLPLIDELVVVDDESSDRTREIAAELGARVTVRPLHADFSAQRNAGLADIRAEWVLTIDADEVLDPELIPLLERAARWPRADVVFVPRLNLITEQGEEPAFWPDLQPKLFRSHLRYRGVLHEQVSGWKHPLFTPLSGPYVMHRKSLARQRRQTLLYDAIDPHSPGTARIRRS